MCRKKKSWRKTEFVPLEFRGKCQSSNTFFQNHHPVFVKEQVKALKSTVTVEGILEKHVTLDETLLKSLSVVSYPAAPLTSTLKLVSGCCPAYFQLAVTLRFWQLTVTFVGGGTAVKKRRREPNSAKFFKIGSYGRKLVSCVKLLKFYLHYFLSF